MTAVVAAGCVSTHPAPPTRAEGMSASAAEPSGHAGIDLAAARHGVASDEYRTLEAALSGLPGFIALTPSLTHPSTFIAVFSGDVPLAARLMQGPADVTLTFVDHATPQRLTQRVDHVTDLSSDDSTPLPTSSTGIGPGAPILTTIPGEGTFICTANFVYKNGSNYYLGAAGHCFLPAGKVATAGPGADYNANGVTTEICVAGCYFGGELTGFLGDLRDLGSVAYARQSQAGVDIGHDFGLVRIPASLVSLIHPKMPMWNGPTGADGNERSGDFVVQYGNGVVNGNVFVTKGRAGMSLDDSDPTSWQALLSASGGDSGSAVNHADLILGTDALQGTKAQGLLTHGLIVEGAPLSWGTTITQAISMARQAGLTLTLMT